MSDHEKAYRDLRAAVEAQANEWEESSANHPRCASDEDCVGCAAGELRALLAPAPASEPLGPTAEVSPSPKAAQSPASETARDWRDVPHVHAGTDCGGGDDCPARPESCVAPPGNLCADTGCWDADKCLVYRTPRTAPTPPTTVQAERDAGQVRLSEYVLLTEKCTERNCGTRTRYSELTDDLNTHWHVKPGMALVAARQSDPDATERVASSASRKDRVNALARLLMEAWENAEGKPVNPSYVATFADMARAVLAADARSRRTVTTGEWEVAE